MKNTVYVCHDFMGVAAMFRGMGYEVIHNLNELPDFVAFTGGADISPSLYGHERHPETYTSEGREKIELEVYEFCREHDIPMVGICRGAQLLNALSGGEMYQHVTHHQGSHDMVDVFTGETIVTSSIHHQMMKPHPTKAILVAKSHQKGRREWMEGHVIRSEIAEYDPEVVFYPETKSLCVQGHPEISSVEYVAFRRYFGELLNRYL